MGGHAKANERKGGYEEERREGEGKGERLGREVRKGKDTMERKQGSYGRQNR